MNALIVRLQNRIADRSERGAAMAEYGFLLTLVALLVIATLTAFGSRLNDLFAVARDVFNESPGGKLGSGETDDGAE